MPELKAIADYNRRAMRAAGEGRLEQALLNLSMALRLAREIRRVQLESYSKGNMGLVYLMAGKRREAAVCFRLALQRAKTECGSDHPLCYALKNNIRKMSVRQRSAA
ncbi:hypothetical protein SAMN02745704_00936 [Paucidesulfovibrio gracilis DSM 16080]|uniref:Tetratricopeptide repeat-containing protein n=1 Tax=Paucidesulfovibrio gracilis DSM 16080 TaxID=1121449 RepID=A0A1T4WKB8_9BACT|nr:tetratricopeptide repeat protein [Paucidesulfovibrio gracilis]SKA77081.1 hypothetical protein SAMN02745704_00936 [Paucidesulfovibrio gracilis DSM 16080]